jgi:hypothetical protein
MSCKFQLRTLKFLKNNVDIFGVDVTIPTRAELIIMGALISSVFL